MKKVGKGHSRLKAAQDAVQGSAEEITDKIEELERYLIPYERIKEEIDKLKAARRALLGGTHSTGGGSTKVMQSEIVDLLTVNPGQAASQIAEHFKVPQTTISSHLYRGKDDRFLSKGGLWYIRDPKNGINTASDIKE